MSLLDRIIHSLDEQRKGVPFHKNKFKDIKDNIALFLNAKLDDCLSANDLGMNDIIELNLNGSELCSIMAKEIHHLIGKYEPRIKILSIRYDNTLSPWQLSFMLECVLHDDNFQQFGIEIIFKNNRYCEVI